jgi:hypothetical protein
MPKSWCIASIFSFMTNNHFGFKKKFKLGCAVEQADGRGSGGGFCFFQRDEVVEFAVMEASGAMKRCTEKPQRSQLSHPPPTHRIEQQQR